MSETQRDETVQNRDDAVARWEARYATSDPIWSGKVNPVLAEVAANFEPGRALDLGCGEGGDIIWLANRGWQVTGVDIAPSAIRRARDAATAAGFDDSQVKLIVDDFSGLPDEKYDLVSASFLHNPVGASFNDLIRNAASHVVPGGNLLVTLHATFPPVPHLRDDPSTLVEQVTSTPEQALEDLALDQENWVVKRAYVREREVVRDGHEPKTWDDLVILARRI